MKLREALLALASFAGSGCYMVLMSQWPHNSNGADPRKAEIFPISVFVSRCNLIIACVGLLLISLSPHARRSLLVWTSIVAAAIGATGAFATAYM